MEEVLGTIALLGFCGSPGPIGIFFLSKKKHTIHILWASGMTILLLPVYLALAAG